MDYYVVPIDAEGLCTFCGEKECPRIAANVFFQTMKDGKTQNRFHYRQNDAVLHVCKEFVSEIKDSSNEKDCAEIENPSEYKYIYLRFAGKKFTKFYLPTADAENYYRHLKKTRLAYRFPKRNQEEEPLDESSD